MPPGYFSEVRHSRNQAYRPPLHSDTQSCWQWPQTSLPTQVLPTGIGPIAALAIHHRPLFSQPRVCIAELFEPLSRPRSFATNLRGFRNKHPLQEEADTPAFFRARLDATAHKRPAKFKCFG